MYITTKEKKKEKMNPIKRKNPKLGSIGKRSLFPIVPVKSKNLPSSKPLPKSWICLFLEFLKRAELILLPRVSVHPRREGLRTRPLLKKVLKKLIIFHGTSPIF
jgi:hypothetical protein